MSDCLKLAINKANNHKSVEIDVEICWFKSFKYSVSTKTHLAGERHLLQSMVNILFTTQCPNQAESRSPHV